MRRMLAFFIALLFLVSFVGCSAPEENTGAGTGGVESDGGNSRLVTKENIKKLNLAWINDNIIITGDFDEAHRQDDDWFPYEQVVKGLELFQEDYGLNIDIVNSSDFADEENSGLGDYENIGKMVDKCLESGYDGIILCDAEAHWHSDDLIYELKQVDIPVVTLGGNTYSSDYTERIANVGFYPAEFGIALAQLTNKVLEGQGQVAAISPRGIFDPNIERFESFVEGLGSYPGIELIIIDYDEYAEATSNHEAEKFEEFRSRYPNLDAFVKSSNTSLFGFMELAFERAYSFSDASRTLKLIKSYSSPRREFEESNLTGNKTFGAISTNLVAAAYDAASVMVDYLTTGEVPKDNSYTYLLVTQDNYKDTNSQFLDQVKRSNPSQ